jgi:MSHA biogenesis protein MshL
MKKLKLTFALSTIFFTLVGCQSVPNDPVDMKESLNTAIKDTEALHSPKPLMQVPTSVQQELMLDDINAAKQGMLAEKRLNFSDRSVGKRVFPSNGQRLAI